MSARDEGLLHEKITRTIIGAFFEVYNKLGPGYLESVYAAAMERALKRRGLNVEREVRVLVYLDDEDDDPIARQRMDMVVEDVILVENKAKKQFPHGAKDQLISYLTATPLEVGLILNFGLVPEFRRYISTKHRR
jgi:GxxExxY protein